MNTTTETAAQIEDKIAKLDAVKDEKAAIIRRFNSWFNESGHWIYKSKEAAMAKWVKDGIEGLPRVPR